MDLPTNFSSAENSFSTFSGRFPFLLQILGENWLHNRQEWPSSGQPFKWWAPWLIQLEQDLGVLLQKLPAEEVRRQYRVLLRDHSKLIHAVYEVHGAAFLAGITSSLRLHAPRSLSANISFDYQAAIEGMVVNAEMKTRADDFLFSGRQIFNEEGEPAGYVRERETVDPHDAPGLHATTGQKAPDSHYHPIPESTVLRQVILNGLGQLPDQGINILCLAHIQGERRDLERALYGTEVLFLNRNHENKTVTSQWALSPTGAFRPDEKGDPFRTLSAVLWLRLTSLGGAVGRTYKLYPNPFATSLLPKDVQAALEKRIEHLEQPLLDTHE